MPTTPSTAPASADRVATRLTRAPLVPGARHEPPLPALMRNASTSIPRLLQQLRRMTTLCVTSFQGEIDFDLFGILLTKALKHF